MNYFLLYTPDSTNHIHAIAVYIQLSKGAVTATFSPMVRKHR